MTREYVSGDAEYAAQIAPLIRDIAPKILEFLHERHGANSKPDEVVRDIHCISASLISSMIGELVPAMFWEFVAARLGRALSDQMVPMMEARERIQ